MPPSLGARTIRITVVLLTDDVELMRRRYGHGWTQQIRKMVHENCRAYRQHKSELDHLLEAPDGD